MLVKITDLDSNEVWIDVESVRKVVRYSESAPGPGRTQIITEDGSDVWTNESAQAVAERVNKILE